MSPDRFERVIPTPVGFSSDVKQKAARAERSWEATTGLFGALSATGTAALAAGVAIPPAAPFLALVAASAFYFKLRAKWAKEDPPRTDFQSPTEYRPPRLDLMPVMPRPPIGLPPGAPPIGLPPGAGLPTLLHAAGSSIEATVSCVERAMGASAAEQESTDEGIRIALVERVREAYEHAKRTEALTMSIRDATEDLTNALIFGPFAAFRDQAQLQTHSWAGKSLAEMMEKRDLGRLVATGVDESLLRFSLPNEVPVFDVGEQNLLAEASTAAEELGTSLRQWALELLLQLERP